MPAVNNLKIKSIKTRTPYVFCGSDYSQQE